jgi:hypothetical protein
MPRHDDDYDDDDDDRPRRPRRRARDDDDDDDDDEEGESTAGEAASIIVPYRNGMALASYYCGVFGLIPIIGLLLGPIAFILGILGFLYKRNHPNAHGTGHAIAGIILCFLDFAVTAGAIVWFMWYMKQPMN